MSLHNLLSIIYFQFTFQENKSKAPQFDFYEI